MGQLGDLSPGGSVAVGVIVGLISTSVQSLGLTLQRKSHILEDEKAPHDPRRPPHRRRRWQLGMLMFVVSNLLGSTIQITTLPLPVLSTLQASGLVFNSICATLILGEPFTRWSFGGTVLVCGGAILIALFGAIAEPAHNLDQLLLLLGRKPFVLWMIGQAIIVVLIAAGARATKSLSPRSHNSSRLRLTRGIAYGAISGILSAHSLLVAKTAVELLVRTIVDRVNQFNRWQSWVILLGLLALALTQLYYLHRGLKLCSTSVLYPLVFCIYNIIAILDGLIYFRQASRLSLSHALLIAFGTVILLLGVLALSWRLNTQNEQTQPSQAPQVAQSALTPGLGFVDDTTSTDDSGNRGSETPLLYDDDSSADEEALLEGKPDHSSQYGAGDSYAPLTPTSKYDNVLRATRVRRRVMTEADEIWEELEDENPSPIIPSASTPQGQLPHRRVASSNAALSTPHLQRSVRYDWPSPSPDGRSQTPAETTPLLSQRHRTPSSRSTPPPRRSVTFHGQRLRGPGDREPKRRMTSLSNPFASSSSNAAREQDDDGEEEDTEHDSQDANGGWWKMDWWKHRRKD
ncbi:MAG: hypothetical protein M4579_006240 [Chaenotheca gracillima]|nr:MAG: hypothetical protein M4579_006240 [Chaenotheca gracillima]